MTIRIHLISVIIIITVLFLGCKVNKEIPHKIDAAFSCYPKSGLTTTTFEFKIPDTLDICDNENPVFIRFDWDGDGNWDMMHSTLFKYSHRYYHKGVYTAQMELSNLAGQWDTISQIIEVGQGFSPPKPCLIITPDSSNLLTEFRFDGSRTSDDEDSLETLQFRWDFNGDDEWDTDFQSEPFIFHTYNTIGYYKTRMEVKDTVGLVAKTIEQVIANRYWDKIKPKVKYLTDRGTIEDLFHLDASGSYLVGVPEAVLTYSWDLFNDLNWDIQNSIDPFYTTLVPQEGSIPVKLRVTAPNGLYMDTLIRIDVHPLNSPPNAVLTIGCRVGNPSTQFHFDFRRSYDRDDSLMDLKIRWDLNNDLVWDDSLDEQMYVTKGGFTVGKHIIRMAVIDTGGKETIVKDSIIVYNGNHKTGLITDKRPNYTEYYGVVKIGNQWWMQENFNSEFQSAKDGKSYDIIKTCYNNNIENCNLYGGLYRLSDLNIERGLCPSGWRIPKLEDFNQLMEQLDDDQIAKLMMGGTSEFQITLAGYMDYSGSFKGFEKSTHFWTNDRNPSGVPIAWYFNPEKTINQEVFVGSKYRFYIRCIKK